jgi:hypothetical protein
MTDMQSKADSPLDAPLNSLEGARILARWAKGSGAVLNEYHRQLLTKHGVSTDGIIFSPLKIEL